MSSKTISDLVKERLIDHKEFEEMTLKELREYVTDFEESKVIDGFRDVMSYAEQDNTRDALNSEFDRRLGSDFIRVYNYFNKEKHVEKWGGEVRHMILSYKFKGYTEFAIFKETKAVMNYIKSAGITVDQLAELIKITDTFWYWDMMEHENRNIDLNLKIQDEFVNYVFGDMSEEEAVGKKWFNQEFKEKSLKVSKA